jgi:hypothetical protein
VFGSSTSPATYNQFAYGNDSPVSYNDPTGMGCTTAVFHELGHCPPPTTTGGGSDGGGSSGGGSDGSGGSHGSGTAGSSGGTPDVTVCPTGIFPPGTTCPDSWINVNDVTFSGNSGELMPQTHCWVQPGMLVASGAWCMTVSWSFSVSSGDGRIAAALVRGSGAEFAAETSNAQPVGAIAGLTRDGAGNFVTSISVAQQTGAYERRVSVSPSTRYFSGTKTVTTAKTAGGGWSSDYSVTVDQGFIRGRLPKDSQPVSQPIPMSSVDEVFAVVVGAIAVALKLGEAF